MRPILVLSLALAVGCSGDDGKTDGTDGTLPPTTDTTDTDPPTTTNPLFDHDGDGISILDGDCDDTDPTIYPGADDTPYDDIDADCAGDDDFDFDKDGDRSDQYGGTDCDDADADVNPDADEVCNGVDDDCDDQVDGAAALDAELFFEDADNDTWGNVLVTRYDCDPPAGFSAVSGDCDDTDGTTYPGAPAVACDGADNDCNPATVEPGGEVRNVTTGATYTTVGAAVSGASAGDEIEICDGMYAVDHLSLGIPLTLRGAGAASAVTLDAGGGSPVIAIATAAPITLQGLTLTNGTGLVGAGVFGESAGGGLLVIQNAQLTLDDVVVADNTAGTGAGLYLYNGATIVATGLQVIDNFADPGLTVVSQGGGLWGGADITLTLSDSTFARNTADVCGGLSLGDSAVVTGGGTTTIENNTASLRGGGACTGRGAVLDGLDFLENYSSGVGGGLDSVGGSITDCTFERNGAGLTGGGLTGSGDLDLLRVDIRENDAAIDGAGLDLYFSDTNAVLTDCLVEANVSPFYGAIGGGATLAQARLQSVDTDWGTGAADNSPADVGLVFTNTTHSYLGVASFVCDDDLGTCQ